MATDKEETIINEPQKPKNTKQKVSSKQENLNILKQINEMYTLERWIFIIISAAAGLLVLLNAGMVAKSEEPGAGSMSLLFGSGGLIAVSAARLMYMWNKTIRIIFELSDNSGGKGNGN